MSETLISLNIEERKHLDLVIPFLKARQPTHLFIQEIREADVPLFESELSMVGTFAPMGSILGTPADDRRGNAIFTRNPIANVEINYYGGLFDGQPHRDSVTAPHCVLLTLASTVNGHPVTLACTHLTWTPDGLPTDAQRRNAERLKALLQKYPDVILCGDFNSPRGHDVFDSFAGLYMDNIPASVTTTMDPNLHRAGVLELVVDGVFTSKDITVRNVEVISGVSDHCAIVGTLE